MLLKRPLRRERLPVDFHIKSLVLHFVIKRYFGFIGAQYLMPFIPFYFIWQLLSIKYLKVFDVGEMTSVNPHPSNPILVIENLIGDISDYIPVYLMSMILKTKQVFSLAGLFHKPLHEHFPFSDSLQCLRSVNAHLSLGIHQTSVIRSP